MSKPIVAIVGRPNVGKSMLFNKITGKRLSIVEDTPGVTRDRIYGESDWCGRKFTLVDTGGIEPNTDNQILSFMRQQAQIAIDNATVIVLVVDIKTGMTAADQEVAGMLQRSKKPIVLAVNKMDATGTVDPEFYEFYNLGLGDPIAVSAVPPPERSRSAMVFSLPIKTYPIPSSAITAARIIKRLQPSSFSIVRKSPFLPYSDLFQYNTRPAKKECTLR